MGEQARSENQEALNDHSAAIQLTPETAVAGTAVAAKRAAPAKAAKATKVCLIPVSS